MQNVPPLVVQLALHDRLRAVRIHFKLSQQQMADLMGVRQGSYSSYENGQRDMPLSAFRNLIAALNLDIEWMLFGAPRTGQADSNRLQQRPS